MAPPEKRILLPKLAAEAPGEDDQVLPAASKRRVLPPRRRNASVACQTCRRRKVKCGGTRPKCHQCEKASIDCVYDAPAGLNHRQADKEQIARLQATVAHLRQHASAQSTPVSEQPAAPLSPRPLGASPAGNTYPDVQSSADLIEMLRDQPEGFALQVLDFLKQGRSPKDIIDSIGGNLSMKINPSIHTAARGSITPTQTPLEFQLLVQYPKVYLPLAPLDTASLDLGLLGIEPQNADIFQDPGLSNLLDDGVSSVTVNRVVQPQDVLGRTSFGVDNGIYIDPRLHRVEISHWTSIPISNQFAAEAITLYLNMNQPWWAFFDTDLLLDDLVNDETNFCSSMLVNALLAWATQSYAHYEPMAAILPNKFLDEALRIYDVEKGVDSLTTVAATSLMSMTWTTLGKDKAGHRLQEDSAKMAQRMRLYGESDASSCSPLDLSDERVEIAACATAWGSFNFQMVMSMSYHQEPIPKRTPRFRIPGKNLFAAQHDKPSTEATYTAVCQFWLIVFDMNYLYYLERSVSMASAVAIFQRLLGWADALPAGVQRHESNPDHVLNIHIWFHTAIIDLFRPFEHKFPQPKLPAFAGVNATPRAVIAASIEQLKRLVYQYHEHCESSKYSIIWQSGMLYLVNHILRDLSSNESQFYFLLCMRGYQHLARYMPFVSGIVQSLIVMTKRQGVPLTANTQRLLEEVRDESRRSRKFFSAYPVDLEMVAKDPTSATLEKLTSRFQEEPSGAGQGEASDSRSIPDGWKGTVQDLTTTLSMLEDD
ncbi:conidial development fluffy [Fusarium pseudocircinatum]|uniref:Conidial development fluffy n=1 Tax=Fusarium pseudocircinatum TaxID=56676 RepID=A0A8H5LCK6_9HYPO|nr:conidial development fluffy [Fusarium pseudocircinatum]